MQHHEALMRVYPLADAVQFPLFVCRDKKSGTRFLKGHSNSTMFAVALNEKLDLSFKCRVVASGLETDGSFILFETLGDLLILLTYDWSLRELSLSLVDVSAVSGKGYLKCTTIKGIYDALSTAVRGTWIREEKNEHWTRIDAVDPVDGSVEEVAGDVGAAGQASPSPA